MCIRDSHGTRYWHKTGRASGTRSAHTAVLPEACFPKRSSSRLSGGVRHTRRTSRAEEHGRDALDTWSEAARDWPASVTGVDPAALGGGSMNAVDDLLYTGAVFKRWGVRGSLAGADRLDPVRREKRGRASEDVRELGQPGGRAGAGDVELVQPHIPSACAIQRAIALQEQNTFRA